MSIISNARLTTLTTYIGDAWIALKNQTDISVVGSCAEEMENAKDAVASWNDDDDVLRMFPAFDDAENDVVVANFSGYLARIMNNGSEGLSPHTVSKGDGTSFAKYWQSQGFEFPVNFRQWWADYYHTVLSRVLGRVDLSGATPVLTYTDFSGALELASELEWYIPTGYTIGSNVLVMNVTVATSNDATPTTTVVEVTIPASSAAGTTGRIGTGTYYQTYGASLSSGGTNGDRAQFRPMVY